MDQPAAVGAAEQPRPAHDLRGVLAITAFRRLWIALTLSSLGDWLGFLATTSLAAALVRDQGYAAQNFAVAGVLALRLTPAVLLGPIAGVIADRFDRRITMVSCDMARAVLFASIPIIGTLWWLLIASFLIEALSMFWIPAKEASVPNLVPRERLEAANQLSLFTTYGTAPVAAALFALLSFLSALLTASLGVLAAMPVALALFVNAATFLFSAATIWRLEIPTRHRAAGAAPVSVVRGLLDGWRFVSGSRLVRGLVIGMTGAFTAAGAVIGLSRIYVSDLGAGNPGYALLFGAVFFGLAGGMFAGPRLLAALSRRRLAALSICGAGLSLATLAAVPNMVIAALLTVLLGAFSGTAWVTGYTLIGLGVADELRGRTFAFIQSLVRVTLLLVIAVAPLASGVIGQHELRLTDDVSASYNGAAITMFLAGLLAAGVGVVSYRHMDDRQGVPLWRDVAAAVRGSRLASGAAAAGVLVAFEGGEGAGKSTQSRLLADWVRGRGHEVVLTREPGGTAVGRQLRATLLDPASGELSARAEALLYAADRAEHVATVIRPALARGAVVVTDRFVDSSLAYQGAGRSLPAEQVAQLSRWATGGLVPDLTVVLDLPPETGLGRSVGPTDRLEAEPAHFHERVRGEFLRLARADPDRYLVIDAAQPTDAVAAAIRERLSTVVLERVVAVPDPLTDATSGHPMPVAGSAPRGE